MVLHLTTTSKQQKSYSSKEKRWQDRKRSTFTRIDVERCDEPAVLLQQVFLMVAERKFKTEVLSSLINGIITLFDWVYNG